MRTKIKLVGFDGYNNDTVAEIGRNISVLLATPEGTCAGDRRYGLDWSCVDLPAPMAKNMIALDLAEKLPLYESRADIISVECEATPDGQLSAVIRIGPARNASEDEEDEDNE